MTAGCEILPPRVDVWSVLAGPFHVPDRWPGTAGVEPDTLAVSAVDSPRLLAEIVRERPRVRVDSIRPGRTGPA